jgi:hypothetical protein
MNFSTNGRCGPIGEDEIEWLELRVNYAGENLTWEDVMCMRMERAIERQIAELRERNIGGMEEL